jgi:predicted DNA-binding transcriptional regulator YafY
MGRASKDDTIAGIYHAFLSQRTWRQAELANFVGVSTRAIRQRLTELSTRGMPLQSEDDPPHVYWSVPKSWFPGGITLTAEEATQTLRELWLLPKSVRRDRVIAKLVRSLQQGDGLRAAGEAVVPMAASAIEARQREVIEESLLSRSAVRVRYFSAHRGALEWRHISPVRLVAGPPLRLVAWCHRSDGLRWFRVDGMVEAALDASEPLRPASPDAADKFIAESADGYRDESPVMEHIFVVYAPDARWVGRNLLAPMTAQPIENGIRVAAKTAGVLPLARFVVGLGASAAAETSPLREIVRELARGALASEAGPRKASPRRATLNKQRVRSIRQGR